MPFFAEGIDLMSGTFLLLGEPEAWGSGQVDGKDTGLELPRGVLLSLDLISWSPDVETRPRQAMLRTR